MPRLGVATHQPLERKLTEMRPLVHMHPLVLRAQNQHSLLQLCATNLGQPKIGSSEKTVIP